MLIKLKPRQIDLYEGWRDFLFAELVFEMLPHTI